ELGTEALPDNRDMVKARLGFADWLEKNGDPAWARFIRVRNAIELRAPGDDYPDLVEQSAEALGQWGRGKDNPEFDGFVSRGRGGVLDRGGGGGGCPRESRSTKRSGSDGSSEPWTHLSRRRPFAASISSGITRRKCERSWSLRRRAICAGSSSTIAPRRPGRS